MADLAFHCHCLTDGRTHVVQLRASDRVGVLRRRLASASGIPRDATAHLRLSCAGA